MNELEQTHPWARGRERPPLLQLTSRRQRLAEAKGSARPSARTTAPAPVSVVPVSLPIPAVGAPPPPPTIDWNETPDMDFVSAARLAEIEAGVRARRRRDALALLRLIGRGLGALAALVLLVEAWRHFVNDLPPERQLTLEKDNVAAQVLQRFNAPARPFEVESVRAELVSTPGARRADYNLVVTLRLAGHLYAPADSNGAQPYLQLQRSVTEARDEMLRHRLFLDRPELAEPPKLPLLLALTHRAGEKLVVRVPLEAESAGWHWRLRPRPELAAGPAEPMNGQVLGQFGDTPVLVFSSSQARAAMRPLMAEGRKFVLAVNNELARQGAARARVAADKMR